MDGRTLVQLTLTIQTKKESRHVMSQCLTILSFF